jgi:hypothetical protein
MHSKPANHSNCLIIFISPCMIKRVFLLFSLLAGVLTGIHGQTSTINHWESLVYAEDTWRYFAGVTYGPETGWHTPGFNDASWLQGQGGFGYGDNDDRTVTGPPNPGAVFTRITFQVSDTSQIAAAVLNIDFDDGFVAWINGVEIARSNLGEPGDFPSYNTPASDHEAGMFRGINPPSYLIPKQKLKYTLVNGNNVLAIQVNNSSNTSSDLSCIAYLSVGLTTAGMYYRTVPAWFTEPYTGFAGSYHPLLVLETNGATLQADIKAMVDMGIIDNGPGNKNYLTDPWNDYNGKAGVEYRGSSSMMFPKKNYGFELWTPQGIDTAYSLLGMPAESDWVLHGPYSDKSLMRNFMAYNLFNAMGFYAPRTRFCELFLDGQYQGVYVLLEKIKRDKNRVDISKLKTTDITGDQLTGGYIVKIDRSATDYTDGWFSPYIGTGTGNQEPFFAYHYPKRTDIVQIQKDYIRNKITNFEASLWNSNYKDPYTGYRSYIDVPSFINYFILVELSKNTDGYRLSTFLHKDRDSVDPLIHMGPVWDYDLAFGNADYLEAFNTFGWNYTVPADGWGTPFWWTRLMSDPYFANLLNCYWHSLRQTVLSDESLTALIDSTADAIKPAADRNFIQWPIHGTYVWPNPFYGSTYEEDLAYMKNWILQRAAWIDANIPGAYCTTGTDEIGAADAFSLRAYPNPAFGEINIEVQQTETDNLSMEIYNYTGQLVYNREIGNESYFTGRIALQPGAYVVKVIGKSQVRVAKIIIH